MDTVSSPRVSSHPARFYLIEPRGAHDHFTVRDRQNRLFVRSFRDGDEAREQVEKLNANPPAVKPLFPVSAVRETCWQCGVKSLITDGNQQPVLCPDCRRMGADSTLAELLGNAKALRDGTGVFSVLTAEERTEQLQALIGNVDGLPDGVVVDLAANCADSIARRMGSVAEPVRTFEPSDEPIYVWDGEEPDAVTRFELEGKLEAGDVDPYFHDLDVAVAQVADEPVIIRFPVVPDYMPAA